MNIVSHSHADEWKVFTYVENTRISRCFNDDKVSSKYFTSETIKIPEALFYANFTCIVNAMFNDTKKMEQ